MLYGGGEGGGAKKGLRCFEHRSRTLFVMMRGSQQDCSRFKGLHKRSYLVLRGMAQKYSDPRFSYFVGPHK